MLFRSLLFYTDGLVEERDRDGRFFPLEDQGPQLIEGSLEEALDSLVASLRRHGARGIRDDLALVLAENRS